MKTLVLGGVRSGKSQLAEDMAEDMAICTGMSLATSPRPGLAMRGCASESICTARVVPRTGGVMRSPYNWPESCVSWHPQTAAC